MAAAWPHRTGCWRPPGQLGGADRDSWGGGALAWTKAIAEAHAAVGYPSARRRREEPEEEDAYGILPSTSELLRG